MNILLIGLLISPAIAQDGSSNNENSDCDSGDGALLRFKGSYGGPSCAKATKGRQAMENLRSLGVKP